MAKAKELYHSLRGLKAQLTGRNMQLGGLVGVGGVGAVYELENLEGRKIESAVIRIDPSQAIHALDNPAAIRPAFQETVGSYTATIVPKGRELDPGLTEAQKQGLVEQSLAVFNAVRRPEHTRDADDSAGKLPHVTDLDFLQDIHPGQFMMLPGIDLPQLADLSSMQKMPVTPRNIMLQSIDTYIKTYNRPASVRTDAAADEVVRTMRRQSEALDRRVKEELSAAHIVFSPVPSQQEHANGMEVGGRAKGASLV